MKLQLLIISLFASMFVGCPGFTDYNTRPSLSLLLYVGAEESWRDFPEEIVVYSIESKDSIRVKWDTIYSGLSRSFRIDPLSFAGEGGVSIIFGKVDTVNVLIDIDPNVITSIDIQTGGPCTWPKIDSTIFLGSPRIDSLYIDQSTISRNPQ
jgi:hypothetical protein